MKYLYYKDKNPKIKSLGDNIVSHINCIPTSDFTRFQEPCLGSGPIRDTISTLNRRFDAGFWNMFCLELSKYVTVESISGVPYHKLENLTRNELILGESGFSVYNMGLYLRDNTVLIDSIKEFIRFFIESKKLRFNYVNGSYSIGMSFAEYMILVSNEFISWYNAKYRKGLVWFSFQYLKAEGLLREGVLRNGKLYYDSGRLDPRTFQQYIGKKVCVFKGHEITVDIVDAPDVETENNSVFLNTRLALYIINVILKVINYRYGRNKATPRENGTKTEVKYL